MAIPNINVPSLNSQTPISYSIAPPPQISQFQLPKLTINNTQNYNPSLASKRASNLTSTLTSSGIDALTSQLSGNFSGMFGDTELGQHLGNIFSQGISSAGNTMSQNLLKGQSLTQGLGQNVGNSLAGAGVGMAANYIGKGINSLGGDTKLSRGIGQGVATGIGTVGGKVASNLITTGKVGNIFGKAAGSINPYGLAANIVGSALGAANGPSKEYGGKYGKLTQGMDLAYDAVMVGVNAVPGFGQLVSGMMALNKGLSNVFGSTSGMTVQDAILGSAFTPAPVKWANVWGSSTTSTFGNQSWQNSERTNEFMGNAYGNLSKKFDKAREVANKTYGLVSQGAYKDAADTLDFANQAWSKILKLTDQSELQKIRSQYMSSINNQRYAQDIQGGYSTIARGRLGMKIFNNATNHNIGMRLLSGAALIDNKQLILCNAHD